MLNAACGFQSGFRTSGGVKWIGQSQKAGEDSGAARDGPDQEASEPLQDGEPEGLDALHAGGLSPRVGRQSESIRGCQRSHVPTAACRAEPRRDKQGTRPSPRNRTLRPKTWDKKGPACTGMISVNAFLEWAYLRSRFRCSPDPLSGAGILPAQRRRDACATTRWTQSQVCGRSAYVWSVQRLLRFGLTAIASSIAPLSFSLSASHCLPSPCTL